MRFKVFTSETILIVILTLIGAFLHFYNLNWGSPFYFHPDERNIASAVSQLQFPNQMNPHFFAYGSLPIYTIYFTGVAANYLAQLLRLTNQTQVFTVAFPQAILVGRIFSALFATFLIPILYLLGKKLQDKKTGFLAAFFATTSVGFIQFSHFGTFEMWLTFLGVLFFLICLNSVYKQSTTVLIFMSVIFGLLVAVKVTSLALFVFPFALIGTHAFQNTQKTLSFLKNIVLFVVISAILYILTNPYVFLDTKDFLSSMHYESGVALGTLPIFYTGIFFDTTPIVYQFLHVYPFLINPLMIILFIPALICIIYKTFKHKNAQTLLLASFFLILFLSQAFLFVKWTRYMVPTLPFIYLLVVIGFSELLSFIKKVSRIKYVVFSILATVCVVFAFSYFKTAFINSDSRIDALTFAQRIIPTDATILSEPADLGIVPFQDAFPHLSTFNFYELDTNSSDATEVELQQETSNAHYIILPSQRILQSRIEDPKRFPKSAVFYKSLLNGQLGFHKIYQTPCDIFCKITYLGDPVYWWEQTVSVFDRPTVFIFKKNS